MRHALVFVAVLAASLAQAGDLPSCALSMYHVNELGALGSTPFIGGGHVVKVGPFKDVIGEVFPENIQWLVTLNAEGADIIRAYTARNLGGKVSIHCDGKEVSRPIIRSVVREQLVFSVRKEGQ